jgi:hypothetical protein
MLKKLRLPVLATTSVAALVLLGGTATAQVTIGQVAPTTPTESFCSGSWDEFQLGVSSGASYAIPAPGGVLTSWSTNAGPGAGQSLTMKVFRPVGPGTYSVVAHDGPRPLIPSALNTFPLSAPIAVLPGDIVGIHLLTGSGETACGFDTTSLADVTGWREGDQPDGGVFALEETGTEFRYNVSATLLPPPVVTGIGAPGGSIKGGTPVVITGANFATVKTVAFGATPAAFAVNSEGQITATAPASTTLSKVPVTVTTAAGTASSATAFVYEGCKVPKLGGKKLKASKKKLKKGDCKLGKVKKTGDATAKTGKVIKQNPKPGKILAPGVKVTIKLG